MMSSPASSCARIARSVASCCASSSHGSETRHSSRARAAGTRGGKEPRVGGASGKMSAGESLGVPRQQAVHLAHGLLGGAPVVGRAQALENGLLRLARLLLLDRLVDRVVLAAPLRTHAVMLDEGTTDGPGDLDHLFFQQRRGAERGAPRPLVGQLAEEGDDHRHLGNGHDTIVRVARVTEIVADSPEELVVIGRGAHAAVQVAEILDQQMARAVLASLEVVAAGVDAAEDPWEPGDQEIVLGDVPPDLLAGQGAGGEALEVFRAPEGTLREQFGRQRIEPLLGCHGTLAIIAKRWGCHRSVQATLAGGRRWRVAHSNAWDSRSSVGSPHARPRNASPTGAPSAASSG